MKFDLTLTVSSRIESEERGTAGFPLVTKTAYEKRFIRMNVHGNTLPRIGENLCVETSDSERRGVIFGRPGGFPGDAIRVVDVQHTLKDGLISTEVICQRVRIVSYTSFFGSSAREDSSSRILDGNSLLDRNLEEFRRVEQKKLDEDIKPALTYAGFLSQKF